MSRRTRSARGSVPAPGRRTRCPARRVAIRRVGFVAGRRLEEIHRHRDAVRIPPGSREPGDRGLLPFAPPCSSVSLGDRGNRRAIERIDVGPDRTAFIDAATALRPSRVRAGNPLHELGTVLHFLAVSRETARGDVPTTMVAARREETNGRYPCTGRSIEPSELRPPLGRRWSLDPVVRRADPPLVGRSAASSEPSRGSLAAATVCERRCGAGERERRFGRSRRGRRDGGTG